MPREAKLPKKAGAEVVATAARAVAEAGARSAAAGAADDAERA